MPLYRGYKMSHALYTKTTVYSNCIIHNKAQVALEDMLYCDTNNLSQGININIINTVQCL